MLKEMLECLKLDDDCEGELSNKNDSGKGFIILGTCFRFAFTIAYVIIASILPIYIVGSNEYHMRDIYGELFRDVNWDAIVLINMALLGVISITECLEALSEKRNMKIVFTVLSAVGLIVNALTIILPMFVYGRIELIKGWNIEIKYGMIITLLLFMIVLMPIVIRIVSQINLTLLGSWCKKDKKLNDMKSKLLLLAEVVIMMIIVREVFAIAVYTLL